MAENKLDIFRYYQIQAQTTDGARTYHVAVLASNTGLSLEENVQGEARRQGHTLLVGWNHKEITREKYQEALKGAKWESKAPICQRRKRKEEEGTAKEEEGA